MKWRNSLHLIEDRNRAMWKGLWARFNFPARSFLPWPVTSLVSGYSSCVLEAETPALITVWKLVVHDDVQVTEKKSAIKHVSNE